MCLLISGVVAEQKNPATACSIEGEVLVVLYSLCSVFAKADAEEHFIEFVTQISMAEVLQKSLRHAYSAKPADNDIIVSVKKNRGCRAAGTPFAMTSDNSLPSIIQSSCTRAPRTFGGAHTIQY